MQDNSRIPNNKFEFILSFSSKNRKFIHVKNDVDGKWKKGKNYLWFLCFLLIFN